MLHLPKVLHFTMSLLNTQNSPDEKLLREANYMAPPFFSLPIYSVLTLKVSCFQRGKRHFPTETNFKVEYAISHSHLISLCVYMYFIEFLNAVIVLFNPMRSKHNCNLNRTDWRSERVQVTCLKSQSSNITEMRKETVLSNSRNSQSQIFLLYTHSLYCASAWTLVSNTGPKM